MATPTQFVSLDGTAMMGETFDFRASEDALARRSISIFSRRGIEDHPEPPRPFITQAGPRRPRAMTERQRSWTKRRSTPVQSSSPKKPRGTVLNAVPAAKTIQMTSLEEEMATSPNEEIVSAVESPATPRLLSLSPSSPQSGAFPTKKDASPKRPRSTKRKSSDTRIGIWMNGVAHWDENARSERAVGLEEPSLPELGLTRIQPAEQLDTPRSSRPQLSVIIPGSKPARPVVKNDTSISSISRDTVEMPPRSLASVAPAKRVSKFMSAPDSVSVRSHVVSPLEEATVSEPPRIVVADEGAPKKNHRSSSSESSLVDRDDVSSYSRHSSATSVDLQAPQEQGEPRLDLRLRTGSKVFSIVSPASTGVFDADSKVEIHVANVDKPLPPLPPPSTPGQSVRASTICTKDPGSLHHASSTRSEPPVSRLAGQRRPWKTIELGPIDPESTRTSAYLQSASATNSPTLSQAESALELQLSLLENDAQPTVAPIKRTSVHRVNSVHSVMHPPERAPTLPRRSRKREWRLSRNVQTAAVQPPQPSVPRRRRSEIELRRSAEFSQNTSASTGGLRKSNSVFELHRVGELTTRPPVQVHDVSTLPQVAYEDGLIVLEGPTTLQRVMDDAVLTVSSAEDALLHILEALPNTADLFNTALINKGMYRVFQENEMHLIRTVTSNGSAAAAELREWCPPVIDSEVPQSAGSSQLEHTPLTYMRGHRRDLAVITALKAVMLERCQTFIRRETAMALSSTTDPAAQRFDDAFFRIWTFCKIFGSNRGRDEDITGQLDWLKGGLLANSSDLSATMNMNLEFEMGSVLLNPPEHFAMGNGSGLTAQQLYDMTEIWCCLTFLLQPYQGQNRQAKRCGIFDDCEVFEGDTDREDYLLEEWTAHLLTLGPAVVLEMAEMAGADSSYGFARAKANGWTDWTPPQYSGSRTSFLKEPVSRLYEERISAAALSLRSASAREKKEMTRKRMATLAAEIRLARQSSTYKRLPLIDQAHERAMSVLTRQGSNASNFSFHPLSPSPSPSPPAAEARAGLSRSLSVNSKRQSRPPQFHTPRPLEPKTLVHSQHRRKISPIIEDKVETFNRMSTTQPQARVPDTAEVAIKRITEMGFSRLEAQQALRQTDRGDGLRLDRAVEMLLKGVA